MHMYSADNPPTVCLHSLVKLNVYKGGKYNCQVNCQKTKCRCKTVDDMSAAVVISAISSSVYQDNNDKWGPELAWVGCSTTDEGFFSSKQEDDPWLQIYVRSITLSSITIINRKDNSGEKLRNIEVCAGLSSEPFGNEVVGTFKGPGFTGREHVIMFNRTIVTEYITIQLKGNEFLQINGIRVNEVASGGECNDIQSQKRIEDLQKRNRTLQMHNEQQTLLIDELNGDLIGKDNYYKEMADEYIKMKYEEKLKTGVEPANSKDSGYHRTSSTPSISSFRSIHSDDIPDSPQSGSSPRRMLSRQKAFSQSLDMKGLLKKAMDCICMIKSFYQSEGSLLQDLQENKLLDESLIPVDTSSPKRSSSRRLSKYRSRADTSLEDALEKLRYFEEKVDPTGKLKEGYVSIDKGMDLEGSFISQVSIIDDSDIEDSSSGIGNETPVYLTRLSNSDITRLEKILEESELSSWKKVHHQLRELKCLWEIIFHMLINKGLISKEKCFQTCKFPGGCKLGKVIVENISNVTLHEIHDTAAEQSYESICEVVKPHLHRSMSVGDLPLASRLQLQHSFGALHYAEDKCWQFITEGVGIAKETNAEIESSILPSLEPSHFDEIIKLVTTESPFVTLQQIVNILGLKAPWNANDKLKQFVCEKISEIDDLKRYKNNFRPFVESCKTNVKNEEECIYMFSHDLIQIPVPS